MLILILNVWKSHPFIRHIEVEVYQISDTIGTGSLRIQWVKSTDECFIFDSLHYKGGNVWLVLQGTHVKGIVSATFLQFEHFKINVQCWYSGMPMGSQNKRETTFLVFGLCLCSTRAILQSGPRQKPQRGWGLGERKIYIIWSKFTDLVPNCSRGPFWKNSEYK